MEAWQGVDVRTVNRVLLLSIVFLFALNFTTAEAQGQFEVEVSLQCQPDSVELDAKSRHNIWTMALLPVSYEEG